DNHPSPVDWLPAVPLSHSVLPCKAPTMRFSCIMALVRLASRIRPAAAISSFIPATATVSQGGETRRFLLRLRLPPAGRSQQGGRGSAPQDVRVGDGVVVVVWLPAVNADFIPRPLKDIAAHLRRSALVLREQVLLWGSGWLHSLLRWALP
ncbi:MAG: hypothetical protein IPJ47_10395, partial [Anaerolineales bacterium]|nr:hypothetical protein [Anaerolineales bacterium]